MWESFKIVLDNCKNGNEYNFRKLDPDCKNLHKHPLMLMARSGQETLLKHETTQQLLNLKWRFIPRFAFYSNIFLYLLFLILFAIYTTQLSRFATNNPLDKQEDKSPKFKSSLSSFLIVIIIINLIKKILQTILVDRFSFFVSGQNWSEVITFIMALVAIMTDNMVLKLNLSSISVLSSFIVFSFLIQKLKVFGLYVLAFRRTIQNSAKFFPIFFLIYIGFNLSYRVRTNFGVGLFNTTTGLTLIKTLSMALGELDSDSMGLDFDSIDTALYLNYLIYFLFIGLMCIITFNLFVGIAVGEIKTVLDEADIQQISMRIIFVIKVQETLNRFNNYLCLKWLNISYEEFNYDNEFKFIKTKNKIIQFLSKRFATIEPDIKLVDPSKRLEDNINELSRSTNADLKAIRELLTNQISDVETKLTNSQQRLEDCLVEMSRKTTNNFEFTQQDSSAQLDIVQQKVSESQQLLNSGINELNRTTNEKIKALKNSYNSQLKNTKNELVNTQKQLENNLNNLAALTQEMSRMTNEQFKSINLTFNDLFEKMRDLKDDMLNINDQMNQMKYSQQNLISMSEKFNSQFEDFLISSEVKTVLNELIDDLIEDSKPNETQPTSNDEDGEQDINEENENVQQNEQETY
ncbi:unnamed protein product [Brachionus calyciflorus]|uniref:Uncharacterized protein n=1 Tax=Brachionus calyciflorus TaxID=104777 RepID=A0A813XF10_9BILA|nr:unnamed protein product [Brachionus calyciflorus]